jgi:hypothetical protein
MNAANKRPARSKHARNFAGSALAAFSFRQVVKRPQAQRGIERLVRPCREVTNICDDHILDVRSETSSFDPRPRLSEELRHQVGERDSMTVRRQPERVSSRASADIENARTRGEMLTESPGGQLELDWACVQ